MILKATKNIIAQSKCRILHALHELRKKRARKTSVVQADSTVTFHTITSSTSLFGLSTLNSNRTNHKLRKKLANQKRRHIYVLATLRNSNTILCTNSQTLCTKGLERLRRKEREAPPPSPFHQMKNEKHRQKRHQKISYSSNGHDVVE